MAAPSLYRGQGYTLLASAARTTSSNSGVLTGTAQLPAASAISLFLDVTAFAGDSASTAGFDLYLDTSPDGGTTWLLAEKFARVTSSLAAAVIHFRPTGIGSVEAASFKWITSTTTSTEIVSNTVLTKDNRLRWVLPNGTGQTVAPTCTFGVYATCQPMGSTIL